MGDMLTALFSGQTDVPDSQYQMFSFHVPDSQYSLLKTDYRHRQRSLVVMQ